MATYAPAKIEARLRQILCDELMIDDKQITLDATIMDDLGAEELDLVEIVISIESRFKIEIDDDDTEKFRTVKDILTYLTKRLVRA